MRIPFTDFIRVLQANVWGCNLQIWIGVVKFSVSQSWIEITDALSRGWSGDPGCLIDMKYPWDNLTSNNNEQTKAFIYLHELLLGKQIPLETDSWQLKPYIELL